MPGSAAPSPPATLAPLHLVLGDESFLAGRVVADVVATARAADPECDVRELDLSQLTPGALFELFSPSLFAEARVLIARDAHTAGKDLAAALLQHATALAADPSSGIVLVVTHLGQARGKALADGLKKAGAVTTSVAKITKHRDKIAFVRDEVRRSGGKASEEVAALILESVGSDLRELASVCSQLVADTGGRVDLDTVRQYHRGRADVSGYTVADAAMVGDTAGALEALRWARAIGVDPVPIADALADGVRSVARVAGARGSAYQLASTLGMPPWKVERAQRQGRGWSQAGLATAARAAAVANGDVKGGADDRDYALERAVLAIVSAREVR
ncbi:DNA polymerase III subunit delta [Cryptosporangium minutisporangium]|uniref:DNA-directed DNA polymerase n=1 Tax=Cryptosporangium minutisporangium TaxID=113569 RepID=A0ABP6TCH1_9ACTN